LPTADRGNRAAIAACLQWLSYQIEQLPRRIVVVIGGDFNSHLAPVPGACPLLGRSAIGTCESHRRRWNAPLIESFMNRFGLVATNTDLPPGGRTWANGWGAENRIDCVLAPEALLDNVVRCQTWEKSALSIQARPARTLHDHAPVVLSFRYRQGVQCRADEPSFRWNYDMLWVAAKSEQDPHAFGAAIEVSRQQEAPTEQWRYLQEQGDVDRMWVMLNRALARAALVKFQKLPQPIADYGSTEAQLLRRDIRETREAVGLIASRARLLADEVFQLCRALAHVKAADKQLSKQRRADAICRKHELAERVVEESCNKQYHVMWQLARHVAPGRLGAGRRIFGRLPSVVPDLAEWQQQLERNGPEGGMALKSLGT